MKSMTGFGMGEYSDSELNIYVEIKTVNHRYRDFSVKMPRKLSPLEENLKKAISAVVTRGRVEVSVRMQSETGKGGELFYDRELAMQYSEILNMIRSDIPFAKDDISVSLIAKFPDVVTLKEETTDLDYLWECLSKAVNDAAAMLDKARTTEGENLKGDFIYRISLIEGYIAKIKEYAQEIPKAYYEQLRKSVEEFVGGIINENRIATEMAIYADNCSITEELVRLGAHLKSFLKIIESKEPSGRKLDFLLQEINREANTIASKSNSFEISSLVVEIKSELEKMREQIQNIE